MEIYRVDSEILSRFKYSSQLSPLISHVSNDILPVSAIVSHCQGKNAKFYRIIEELHFRGFSVYDFSNKDIYSMESKDDELTLYVNSDKKIYKNIDFSLFGLIDLVYKFSVDNDRFFDGINLDSFKLFNKKLQVEQFKNYLSEIGFRFRTDCQKNVEQRGITMLEEGFLFDFRQLPNIEFSKKWISKDLELIEFLNDEFSSNVEIVEHKYSEILETPYCKWLETEEKRNNGGCNLPAIPIDKVFDSRSFLLFFEYCKSIGVEYLSELTQSVINDFSKQHGVGKSKVKNVEAKLDKYRIYTVNNQQIEDMKVLSCPLAELIPNKLFSELVSMLHQHRIFNLGQFKMLHYYFLKNEIDEELSNHFFRELDKGIFAYGVYEDFLNQAKDISADDPLLNLSFAELGITNDLHFDNLTYSVVIKDFGLFNKVYQSKYGNGMINSFKKSEPIQKYLDEMLNLIDDRSEMILLSRLRGMTLEDIGKEIGFTRERARQIEMKASNKISWFTHSKELEISVAIKRLFIENDYYVDTDLLMNLFSEKQRILFNEFIADGTKVSFSPACQCYFIGKKSIESTISDYIDMKEKECSISEILEMIWATYQINQCFVDETKLMNYLKHNGFNVIDNTVVNDRISSVTFYLRALQNFPEGINIYSDFELFKSFIPQSDRINLNNLVSRNVEARLINSNDAIQIGSHTFIHSKFFKIYEGVFDFLSALLKIELTEKHSTNAAILFKKYEDQMLHYGITNKHVLYFLVKSNFESEYYFGRGNTLTISISKEDLVLDYESKIINTVIQHGGKIDRSILVNEIATFPGNFDSIVDACDDLIRISSVIYHKDSFELYIPLYNGISEFLNNQLVNKPFISIMTLFKMMNFDPRMYDIFKSLSITEARDLVQIIKSIKTVILEGVGVMIFPVYANYRSVLEYMSLEYSVVNMDEYAKILYENEYSDQSIYGYQVDLLESKNYYRINDTDYVLKSKINVDENIISVLLDFVRKHHFEEYIIAEQLKGFRKIGYIDSYPWTMHLVCSVLTENGYSPIKREYTEKLKDKPILVKDKSTIKTMADLIYAILYRENIDDYSLDNLLSILALKGIRISEKVFRREIENFELIEVDRDKKVYIGGRFNG